MGVDTAHIAIAGMHARAEVWTPDNQDQPIEKRIEGIIRDLDRIRIKPGEHDKFVEELRDSQEEHKKKVAEENKNMEDRLRSDLESLHTSDLIISLIGLVWIIVGISMSTMAPELANWVK